jgi:hypothetical protein
VHACDRRGGGPAPPPLSCDVACAHEHTRNAARKRAHAHAHAELSSRFCNLGIQGVKGQGRSSTDPMIGGDSRNGAKKKGLAFCQALGCQRVLLLGYSQFSPAICQAWRHAR